MATISSTPEHHRTVSLSTAVPNYFQKRSSVECIKYRAIPKFVHVSSLYLIICCCTTVLLGVSGSFQMCACLVSLYDFLSSMRLTEVTCVNTGGTKTSSRASSFHVVPCSIFVFPWLVSLCGLPFLACLLISYSRFCLMEARLASSFATRNLRKHRTRKNPIGFSPESMTFVCWPHDQSSY